MLARTLPSQAIECAMASRYLFEACSRSMALLCMLLCTVHAGQKIQRGKCKKEKARKGPWGPTTSKECSTNIWEPRSHTLGRTTSPLTPTHAYGHHNETSESRKNRKRKELILHAGPEQYELHDQAVVRPVTPSGLIQRPGTLTRYTCTGWYQRLL